MSFVRKRGEIEQSLFRALAGLGEKVRGGEGEPGTSTCDDRYQIYTSFTTINTPWNEPAELTTQ